MGELERKAAGPHGKVVADGFDGPSRPPHDAYVEAFFFFSFVSFRFSEKLFLSFIRGPLSSFNASNRNIDFFQKKDRENNA